MTVRSDSPIRRDALEDRAARGDPAAQVALAAALDASGQHAPAIDWLARAAQANHPPALRLLGLRLSTGTNAPGLPVEGADLIRAAAQQGDGAASALCAVFAGVGYLQPQDWAAALEHLRAAAAHGWAPARAQCALIERGPAGDGTAAWLSAPEGRIVSDSPRVIAFDRLVAGDVCRALIDANRDRLARAQVVDPLSGRPIVGKTRTNRAAPVSLFESDLLHLVVQVRLAAAAGVTLPSLEAPSILHYRVGEEARDHFDFIDPAAPGYAIEVRRLGLRIATILLYLNDDYTSGETAFPALGLAHRGRACDALLFFNVDPDGAPDRRTLHAGRSPATGEKWVLSQFIRNRPQL